MRIRAERDELADVFSRASRAVGLRPAQPILQGVLCETIGSKLRVTGTDLEATIRTTAEVDVQEEGRVVVPGRLATEAIRKMPEGVVVIEAGDGEIAITGRGPRFSLRELSVADYPELGEPNLEGSVTVAGDALGEAIAQVGIAASGDAARPILTGVLFEPGEEGLRLVATDSYRLAVREIQGFVLRDAGLVPAKGLKELSRAIGATQIQVAVGTREIVFGSERGSLTLRLIEGNFPNYRQLLPESHPNRLVVEKEHLLEALDRAGLVAEDHIPVRIKMMEGGAEMTVTRQDVGGEVEHINGTFEGDADEVLIAFNPRYLSEGVAAIAGDQVQLQVMDGLKPAVLKGVGDDSFLYLLMPVRI
ncbi:DNA polymerase III subunit beta [bacterium BMS3Abin02]|nr:DNA polymerase III subunit beta [bacterium BMS3Abin02]GBE22035.1 DNA polymerase III subunit beta [bacterium BMS3Bbin01]